MVDPEVVYTEPYYSNVVDVPPRAKMFAGRMFTLKGNTVSDLTEFRHSYPTPDKSWLKTRKHDPQKADFGWEYAIPPPRWKEVVEFCEKEDGIEREYTPYFAHRSRTASKANLSTGGTDAEKSVWLQVLAKEKDKGVGKRATEHVSLGH